MKNILTTAALLATAVLSAQTTATVSLNVTLHSLISISVNQPTVAFDIDTESEYLNGAETTITNHLNTFSTSGYQVTAKYLTSDFADDTIGVTASGVNNVNYNATVPLKSTVQQLFKSTNGLGRKSHNVKYKVKGGLHDLTMGDYETVVVYSIIAN